MVDIKTFKQILKRCPKGSQFAVKINDTIVPVCGAQFQCTNEGVWTLVILPQQESENTQKLLNE